MTIVINSAFGGYRVPEEVATALNCWQYEDSAEVRTAPEFIAWVENHPESTLTVVEIPEDATDWEINEYDGLESITAVVGGRLVHISGREW